jgi:hypothetical protein
MNFSKDYSTTKCNIKENSEFTGYGYIKDNEIYCRKKEIYHTNDKTLCPNSWTDTNHSYYRDGYVRNFSPYCKKNNN